MKEKDLLRLEQLEATLRPLQILGSVRRPHAGWIRAIREALGMSSRQLARRMNIKAAQSVEDMQDDERSGTIKLRTLKKVADALDCDVVYALIPRGSLEDVRRRQATALARSLVSRVGHSMRLENQGVDADFEQREIDRRIARLLAGNPRALWD